ncbi:MAG: transposase [Armatimonadota bacterium]
MLSEFALPALGTLVYRFHHLQQERLQQLLTWLAQQGIALEQPTGETPCAFVDGTGFGYAGVFVSQYLRGAAVRRQRAHVKATVMGYSQGGQLWVMGLSLGEAYADEGRLLREWVERYGRGGVASGTLLVGDGLYGHRAELLRLLEGVGFLPVARVREGLWHGVRSDARLRARLRAQQYSWALRERYRIEQLFGSVKGAYGSVCRARSWAGAMVWVWGMFVLWNLVGVVRLAGGGSFFVAFFVVFMDTGCLHDFSNILTASCLYQLIVIQYPRANMRTEAVDERERSARDLRESHRLQRGRACSGEPLWGTRSLYPLRE